ncbi:unnamed protein product, partial [Iphiclides podalirius]
MGAFLLLQIVLGVILPAAAKIGMGFTKYPESVTAPVGDEVTFECAVEVPGEKLTWRWKPADSQEEDWRQVEGVSDRDSLSTRLVVDVKEETPNSLYQCIAWYGAISVVSIPAWLTIARMDLSKNTAERRVIAVPLRNTVVLHCKEPMSEPPAVLNWWKEDGKIKKQLDTPHGVLVLHNVSTADSGVYGCTATNELSVQTIELPERTYLKVQHEGNGAERFIESEDYVGKKDDDGALTVSVKIDGALRLWCGAVGTPPPRVVWTRDGVTLSNRDALFIQPFTLRDEGIYSCSTNGVRRSWKVVALLPPHWEGSADSVNASEGGSAKVTCGLPYGQPAPAVHWLLNAELMRNGKGVKANDTDLYIERVEKKHAGIVQCFACNTLGCAFDAAILTVVPVQISDQDYSAETPKIHIPQLPKRHNKKNPRKHKAVMIRPSRPNVTRMSDESVMVSWSNAKEGLPIQFFKVQYSEVSNSSNSTNSTSGQWQTANYDIPSYIHAFEIDGLVPDRYYKFRIAAVYSNQDNKMGRSSPRFYLQRGGQSPQAPVLTKVTATSPYSIQIEWTWSGSGGVEAEGFYVYYRAVSSAGAYEKVSVGGGARALTLDHLAPDTAYEVKVQAYSAQAPSDFSAIRDAKTHKSVAGGASTSTEAPRGTPAERAPAALVTAGGALGVTAILLILVVTLLLCRRAKRPNKEKVSVPETGSGNGYMPAKVPITITANPMHPEGGEAGVEMSFLHNNNTGSSDEAIPHSRKNGPARQYV